MAETFEKVLKQQERELLKLEDREVNAFLKSYTESRKDLRERLDAITVRGESDRWTAQHTRMALAEVEDGIRVMQDKLGTVLTKQAIKRRDVAFKHLTKTIGHFEPQFAGMSGGINLGAMKRLSASGELLLHKYSTQKYSADLMGKVQAELARGHSSRLSRDEVVKRIAGTDDSVFSGMEHRAALIDRMENARAYDASFRAGLEEAAEELDEEDDDDPLLKKAVEFIDKRSHPFSAAVDGRVARVGGDWEVPLAEVRAEGVKMKKGIGGILWTLEGGMYKGAAYPAHYNDRGRGVPWRASWGPFKGEIPAAVKVEGKPEPKEVKAEEEPKADDRAKEAKPAKPAKEEKAAPVQAPVDKAKEKEKAERLKAFDALKKSGAGMKTRGLNPLVRGPSEGLLDDMWSLDFARDIDARRIGPSTSQLIAMSGKVPSGIPSRVLRGSAKELQSLARVASTAPSTATRLNGLAARLASEDAAHSAHQKAYKAAASVARPSWLKRQRQIAARRLLNYSGHDATGAQLEAFVAKALEPYPVDLLHMAASEGVTFGYNGITAHPAFKPGGFGQSGRVLFRWGTQEMSFDPFMSSHKVSHEFGHVLDAMMSATGQPGTDWEDRPGYEWAGLYRATFGDVFDRIKKAGGGGVANLAAGRLQTGGARATGHWIGDWINTYEARIYSAGPMPNPAELLVRAKAGPIEFIAQAFERSAYAVRLIEHGGVKVASQPIHLMVGNRSIQRTAASWVLFDDIGAHSLVRTRYGKAMAEGMEKIAGTGSRLLDRIGRDSRTKFDNDGDVVGTAWLFREFYGIPLKRSLGPGGPLSKFMSKPYVHGDFGVLPALQEGKPQRASNRIRTTLDGLTGEAKRAKAREEQRVKEAAKEKERRKAKAEEPEDDNWLQTLLGQMGVGDGED